jgi:hypothetical protein
MSGYSGQKLGLKSQDTSSAVRLTKGEPFFGCQDILDRNCCSGHLFSCQAGEKRAFLWMSGYPGQKLVLRTPLQLSGWRNESLSLDVRISWTETGAQDTSSANSWQKESLSSDVRLSGTQVNAHNASSAVRKLWARAYPQDKLFQLPVGRRIIM